jgi:hypothetical protein
MQGEVTKVDQKPLAEHPPVWKQVLRVIAGVFWVIGGIANVLGIYGFGESHQWWRFTFAISPEMTEVLWMLAVGVGGPWAMMLGGVAGARFSEIFVSDRTVTDLIKHTVLRVGSFLALLHCTQMMFDIKIFPNYLSSDGFVKIVAIYLAMGLAICGVFPLILHAARRFKDTARAKGRPTQRSSGRKPPKTRFRRSPS